MQIFHSVVVSLLVASANIFALAQQTAATSSPSEIIAIKLRISNVAFNIEFSPGKDSAESVSRQICIENADTIGVTKDTVDNCITSVSQYVVASLNSYIQERTISVPITVSGTALDVRFRPDQVSTDEMAGQVCSQEKIQAPLLAENKNLVTSCVEPVSTYLRVAVNNWIADKTLSIPVNVNGTKFDVAYLPERQPASDIAAKLCVQYSDVIGGLTNENVVDICVNPIANYLDTAAQSWRSDKTLVLPLTLNNKEFTVKYMPERESSLVMARKLCIERAQEIGGLTNENVVSSCIEPVVNILQKSVQEWIDSKSLVVPIKINGKEFQLKYMPLRVSSMSMAKKLCVENAADIGGVTDENVIDKCIKPVVEILDKAANKWYAEKNQN